MELAALEEEVELVVEGKDEPFKLIYKGAFPVLRIGDSVQMESIVLALFEHLHANEELGEILIETLDALGSAYKLQGANRFERIVVISYPHLLSNRLVVLIL